ncbi:MAG: glycogen synthase GlgA [Clostridia bacterium]|nr:glycogen synthase GlgA [Clostridia bacterium]
MLKVLFIASECTPFAKTGGLGDVVESLPIALRERKIDARVIIPKYNNIPAEYKKEMIHKRTFTVPVAWRQEYGGLEVLKHEGITYYFLDNEKYFKRDGLYGYFDEAERFAYFCRGVLECLPYLDFKPDILHCHDWHTGLIPLFLKAFYQEQPFYQNIKTVFTIHNLKYQGVFPMEILGDLLGLDDSYRGDEGIEFYGKVNCMKAGIVYADKVTTVSETYAEEIKTVYFGENLDGILRKQEGKLQGILNGIDCQKYNPETDPHIYVKYRHSLVKKDENKVKLQEDLHLPVKDVPVLAMVSRLTRQKGLDLLLHILEELLTLDVQLVVLGTGEHNYEQALREAAERHPQKMKAYFMFNEALAHKIYAGSDLYLMPSLFEPCGLSQLIALRYGALPIVRETGGLKDTIISYNEQTGVGNGFSFTNFNAHDFLHTIKRALDFYHNRKPLWNKLFKNALKANFSWTSSAQKYIKLYEDLLTGQKEGNISTNTGFRLFKKG